MNRATVTHIRGKANARKSCAQGEFYTNINIRINVMSLTINPSNLKLQKNQQIMYSSTG